MFRRGKNKPCHTTTTQKEDYKNRALVAETEVIKLKRELSALKAKYKARELVIKALGDNEK